MGDAVYAGYMLRVMKELCLINPTQVGESVLQRAIRSALVKRYEENGRSFPHERRRKAIWGGGGGGGGGRKK